MDRSDFGPFAVAAGGGLLGLCPLPGRHGDYAGDMAALLAWRPGLVLSMVADEALRVPLARDLAAGGIALCRLPIADFGAPGVETAALWPDAATAARAVLAGGGRVLAHCKGGCGRSGMAVLRLMVETGEAPEAALARLRTVRPCAVETAAQYEWASTPTPSG